MNRFTLNDMNSFSNEKIAELIIELEGQLINLYFKKVAQQDFRPHEIKSVKHKLAQLKTILTKRILKEN